MKMSDCGHKTETETIAGHAATSLETVEAIEDGLEFAGGNAGPVVGNGNDCALGAVSHFDINLSALATMFDRVIDDIRQRVEQ